MMLNLTYNALSLPKRTNIRLTERKERDGQINSLYVDLVTLLSMQIKAGMNYLTCVGVCVLARYHATMYAYIIFVSYVLRLYVCAHNMYYMNDLNDFSKQYMNDPNDFNNPYMNDLNDFIYT